ncbi:MAG TPA: outer membrane protein transport protein [Thermoanaerobaculia bacterium]|nr:outer membrane protein transport protein [Thermoanaerobaculia bacterium]
MARPLRVRFRSVSIPLAILFLLTAAPAFPSGFQLNPQGARAMGMGLAFTAVANDPSAIFFNPAGLGWQKHFDVEVGSSFITKTQGDFDGENPFPGIGNSEKQHKTTFTLPTLYVVAPLTSEINFGLGIFSQYGLGFRWDNAEDCGGDCATNPVKSSSFSGRFISQNAVIQTVDLNPVLSFQVIPALAIAVGADYRVSKVQLERNQGAINPFTNSVVDVAHVKLNSDLTDNHGWGWNAGILVRPVPQFSFGAAYRSKIKIDYEGTATFKQRLTGNAQFDGIVASQLPQGTHPVTTSIPFPASVNLGTAFTFPGQFTVSLEGDWTEWSDFQNLDIIFPDLTGRNLHRHMGWKDSWAYRIGLEKKFSGCSCMAVRAGYYRDNTPQPVENAGPLLADNDRDGYTLGFGYDTDRWGVEVSDLYINFKKLDTAGRSQDNYYGLYKETANVFAFSFRFSF